MTPVRSAIPVLVNLLVILPKRRGYLLENLFPGFIFKQQQNCVFFTDEGFLWNMRIFLPTFVMSTEKTDIGKATCINVST